MAFIRGYANNFPHLMGRIGFGAGGPAQVKSINRRFQKLDDYTVKDSVANRDATLLAPVSKYNKGSKTTISRFEFTVGKFIEMDIELYKMTDVEYFLTVGSTNVGIRYRVSDGFLIYYEAISNKLAYTPKSEIERLKIERVSGNTFNIYVDDVMIGSLSATGGNFSDTFNISRIGGVEPSFSFSHNLCNVNFNNELKIPLPHIGVGFDENGDPIKLTNTDVEEDYVKGGSKWLLQHGMMYDRDTYRKDALDPSNIGSWRNLDGGRAKIEDGYLKLGFYGVDNKPWFLNYLKEAIDSGNLASKGKLTTRVRVVKRSGDIRVYMALDGAKGIYKPPFKEDLDYLYFETPTDATYAHLAFGIYGTTGELWIDEIVSYWETVAPNKEDGSPAYDSSGEFDEVINGTTFLNKTPFAIDFHDANSDQTPFEVSFFDKSNVSIWSSNIRSSKYYNNSNPFIWHSSELTQQFIYENVMDAYKYHLWSKLINEFTLFKDIFFYNTALSDNVEICKTKTYVRVGEKDDLIEGSDVFCKTDIIMP